MISMKDFFATALPQPGGGRVAGRAVAARLMGVIASEPPHSPLSDDDRVAAMAEQGFVVARRTIAKYRHANRVPRWQDRQRVSG
jgi:RNA polymerase sigma-54 factor